MCDMVSEMPICTVYSLCRRKTYALFVSVVAVDRWAVSWKKHVHLVVDILFYRISCQSQRD